MAGNYQKGMDNQLMEVMAHLDAVESDLKAEKREHREDVKRLNAKIDGLEKENKLLRDDNARLKSIINNDSTNTSQPPSTDQKCGRPANTFNGRKKNGRKAGGQKGHKGTTLTRAEVEEKIRSGKYRHEIRRVGNPSGSYATKYVVDLDVSLLITEVRIYADAQGKCRIPDEYRSDVTYGPNLKALAVSLYSEGVMANGRIAAFLNAASGGSLSLSSGSIYGFCRDFAQKAESSIAHLEDGLLNQKAVCTDATVVTVNGEQEFIHNFSITETVVCRAMKEKTIKAMEKLRFLEKFTGILVHDHETALYHFGTDHGECNVHIIRYLRKNSEDTGNSWSDKMISLLCGMNKERKKLMGQGKACFPDRQLTEYEKKYDEYISLGRKENKKKAQIRQEG